MGFSANVLKVAGGTAFAQAVLLLSAPILSRIFAPEDFGIAEVVIAIAGFWNVASSLCYERALMLPESDKDAANLLVLSLALDVLSTLPLFVILYFAPTWLSRITGAQGGMAFLWFIPPIVLVAGCYGALDAWNTRMKEFGRVTRYRVATTTSGVAVQLAAGASGYVNAGGLLVGKVVGPAVTTFLLAKAIWRHDGEMIIRSVSLPRILELANRFWKFPAFGAPARLLNVASWQMPTLLLAWFFSPVVVGFYAVGNRLIRMPMNVIGRAIGQVFFQAASEAVQKQRLGIRVDGVFRRLAAIGLIPTIILLVTGPEIMEVVLGRNWREAGIYTQILAPYILFWFISSPLAQLFSVLERQGTQSMIQAVILGSRVGALVLGGITGDPRMAILFFTVSGVLVYGYLSWWLVGVSGGSRRRGILVICSYTIQFSPAAIVLAIGKWWFELDPTTLVAISAIAGLVCVAWLIYRDDDTRRALLDLLSPSFVRF